MSVAWALVATLVELSAGASPSSAAAPVAANDSGGEDFTRPDSVSAAIAARVLEHKVEDLSQRTETTVVFANPDGSWTSDEASEPVRVQNSAGEWHDIDTTLVESDGKLQPMYALTDLSLSDGGERTFASMTQDGHDLSWQWPTTLPRPTVEGDTATYADVIDGGDLVVTATSTGFTHSVVLHERPSEPVEFTMPVGLDGAELVESPTSGILIVKNDNGGVVAAAPRPMMWDSSEDEAEEPVNAAPVDAAVTETPTGGTRLTLSPDEGFLSDPDTVYPVTVDPGYSVYTTGDTWIMNADFTGSQSTSQELRAGTYDAGGHIARSLMKFDTSYLNGRNVTDATLRLRNHYAGSCTAGALRAYQVTANWSLTGLTWANQPPVSTTDYADYSPAHGDTGCAEDNAYWDVTSMVSNWIESGEANYGIRIRAASETNSNTWRKYRSADYTANPVYAPRLITTYNTYPGVATKPAVTPGQVYTPAGGSSQIYTNDTTPKFNAQASDGDGGTVRINFEVHMSTTVDAGTLRAECTTASFSQGANAGCTLDSADALTNGSTYYVRAKAFDGLNWAGHTETATAGWSPWTTLKVDTTAPSISTTSTAFTNGVWNDSPPSSSAFAFNGASDTQTVDVAIDGLLSHLPADGSGDASLTWPTTYGSHEVKATAVDRAGNRSTTVFNFGAGTAGFEAPSENARSTSTFPVELTGPPNALSASLSWRLKNESTWRSVAAASKDGADWDETVSTSSGVSTTGRLEWDATEEAVAGDDKLQAPALVELRGCMSYASASEKCTPAKTVQLVPSAFDDNQPIADLGPATVALLTGEVTIDDVDAADSSAGMGRSFSSFDDATLHAGLFGPGWSDPELSTATGHSDAQVIDNRDKDGSLVVVDSEDGARIFVPDGVGTTTYVPLEPTGDSSSLEFSPGSGTIPDTLQLKQPLGAGFVTTTWEWRLADPESEFQVWEWVGVGTDGPEGEIEFNSDGDHPTWVRESDADAASVCTRQTQKPGCRGLIITYAGTGTNERVASISRVIGKDDQNDVVPKVLATYTYDSGELATVCSGPPSEGAPALCTGYEYTQAGGRTLLASTTPSGKTPWRFEYDASGRLTAVKRERPTGGDAVWSVDYGLSLNSSEMPDLSAETVAEWGQVVVPTRVFAVYEPSGGSASIHNATLYFTDDAGSVTNTAMYGPSSWLLDANWYDARGDVVQYLDPIGWARVQAADPSERSQVASDASAFTVYNTWGDEHTAGTRVVDEYGPARTAVLEDGTTGLFRQHQHTVYDDTPGVDSSLIAGRTTQAGIGLIVKQVDSASDSARVTDYDQRATTFGYDAIVSGDGDGWTLGAPTRVKSQVDGSAWSTVITRYDVNGHEIESRRPGGMADSYGRGNDAHSTVTTYYTAGSTGECGGKPDWAGLVCTYGPPAAAAATEPTNKVVSYSDDLAPEVVEQRVGGVLVRTTTTEYDSLGRTARTTVATTGSSLSNDTIVTDYTFDPDTGESTEVSSNGQSVGTTYDSWGRETSFTDALGATSTTTYDAAGRPASVANAAGAYTYSYLPNGLIDSVTVNGLGTFDYTHSDSGELTSVTYPNGLQAVREYDETGSQTSLTYVAGGNEVLAFNAGLDVDGRTVSQSSPASSQQFAFDELGRLVRVNDQQSTGCVVRKYGFDESSNRSTRATYAPSASDQACQDAQPLESKSYTYDGAGRLLGTGYSYDPLGRATSVAQGDTGSAAASNLTIGYRADDMVASLSQTVAASGGGTQAKTMTYGLDPLGRVANIVTAIGGSESSRMRYRFASSSDSPNVIETSIDGGSTWASTKYLSVPEVGLVAETTAQGTKIQLSNLHGDVVATMANAAGASTADSYLESNEYGIQVLGTTGTQRYMWHGADQRSTDALGGLVLMGARLYNPETGGFTSADPVAGGNATPYSYPQDPINNFDLNGECGSFLGVNPCKAAWKIAMYAADKLVSKIGCKLTGAAAILCAGISNALIEGLDYAGWKYLNGKKPRKSTLKRKIVEGFLMGAFSHAWLQKAYKVWRVAGRGAVTKVLDKFADWVGRLPKGGTFKRAIKRVRKYFIIAIDKMFEDLL